MNVRFLLGGLAAYAADRRPQSACSGRRWPERPAAASDAKETLRA